MTPRAKILVLLLTVFLVLTVASVQAHVQVGKWQVSAGKPFFTIFANISPTPQEVLISLCVAQGAGTVQLNMTGSEYYSEPLRKGDCRTVVHVFPSPGAAVVTGTNVGPHTEGTYEITILRSLLQ